MANFTRATITIPSVEDGISLEAWFYKPTSSGPGPFPVVVAGHGLTLIKEAGLASFGERWASIGWASLIFDYRGFGGSGGNARDRNVVDLKKQLNDYRSVISWAKSPERNAELDANKIVVMGSASSGLHISELASRSKEEGIAGAMAHCPLLDGYATLLSLPANPRLLFWAAVDIIKNELGLYPVYVPAIGKPGEFAFLTTPSSYPGFDSMYGEASGPFARAPNLIAPRACFQILGAQSGLKLRDAECPVLIVMAEEDDMIAPNITREVVGKALGKVKLVLAPGGHFDVMEGGQGFEVNINAQLAFLKSLV